MALLKQSMQGNIKGNAGVGNGGNRVPGVGNGGNTGGNAGSNIAGNAGGFQIHVAPTGNSVGVAPSVNGNRNEVPIPISFFPTIQGSKKPANVPNPSSVFPVNKNIPPKEIPMVFTPNSAARPRIPQPSNISPLPVGAPNSRRPTPNQFPNRSRRPISANPGSNTPTTGSGNPHQLLPPGSTIVTVANGGRVRVGHRVTGSRRGRTFNSNVLPPRTAVINMIIKDHPITRSIDLSRVHLQASGSSPAFSILRSSIANGSHNRIGEGRSMIFPDTVSTVPSFSVNGSKNFARNGFGFGPGASVIPARRLFTSRKVGTPSILVPQLIAV